jgi:hypothetical protein
MSILRKRALYPIVIIGCIENGLCRKRAVLVFDMILLELLAQCTAVDAEA